MHHYALIALLSATPNIYQTSTVPIVAVSNQDPVPWIDKLVQFLEWMCAWLGPEYCPTENPSDPNDLLQAMIDTYEQHGVPTHLNQQEILGACAVIEDMYADLVSLQNGSTPIIDDALETLEAMYLDLGGDPNDLE